MARKFKRQIWFGNKSASNDCKKIIKRLRKGLRILGSFQQVEDYLCRPDGEDKDHAIKLALNSLALLDDIIQDLVTVLAPEGTKVTYPPAYHRKIKLLNAWRKECYPPKTKGKK